MEIQMSKILLIEDEPDMLRGLRDNLEFEGYEIDTADNGKTGLEKFTILTFDLVILDVMLPGMSGFDVLKKGREQGIKTPVIMLTAKGEEIDKVLGLEMGADDYMTKPFGLRELLARVKAVLRRTGEISKQSHIIIIGQVQIDFQSYTAVRNGKNLTMTAREFDILKYLHENRNQVISRDQLLTKVWGYDESITSRTVDNFILKIRQKIEDDPANPKLIITIHGSGYKMII